jgi:hypothetical protein
VEKKLASSKATSAAKENDLFAVDIGRMSRQHIIYMMFELTSKAIAENKFKDAKVEQLLWTLLKVFALNQLCSDYTALYECGYFSSGASDLLTESLKEVLL